jgi:hypothetical protein
MHTFLTDPGNANKNWCMLEDPLNLSGLQIGPLCLASATRAAKGLFLLLQIQDLLCTINICQKIMLGNPLNMTKIRNVIRQFDSLSDVRTIGF